MSNSENKNNIFKENYVFFNLNSRASKIKSSYLLKDCISALSSFINKNTVRLQGA